MRRPRGNCRLAGRAGPGQLNLKLPTSPAPAHRQRSADRGHVDDPLIFESGNIPGTVCSLRRSTCGPNAAPGVEMFSQQAPRFEQQIPWLPFPPDQRRTVRRTVPESLKPRASMRTRRRGGGGKCWIEATKRETFAALFLGKFLKPRLTGQPRSANQSAVSKGTNHGQPTDNRAAWGPPEIPR